MDWLDLLAVQGTQESSPTPPFKSINSSALSLLHSPTLTSIQDYWKNHSLDKRTLVGKVKSLLLNILSRLVITFLPRSKCLLLVNINALEMLRPCVNLLDLFARHVIFCQFWLSTVSLSITDSCQEKMKNPASVKGRSPFQGGWKSTSCPLNWQKRCSVHRDSPQRRLVLSIFVSNSYLNL